MVHHSPYALPGSRLECLEEADQLVIHLPARPRRLAAASTGAALLLVGMLVLLFYYLDDHAPAFAILGMGSVAAFLLCVVFLGLARVYLTRVTVLIAPDSVVIKEVLYGKEAFEEHTLTADSRARQWHAGREATPTRHRDTGPGG